MYGFGAVGAAGALVDELATVVAGVSLLIWGGGGLAGGSLALMMGKKIIVFEHVRKVSKKGLCYYLGGREGWSPSEAGVWCAGGFG